MLGVASRGRGSVALSRRLAGVTLGRRLSGVPRYAGVGNGGLSGVTLGCRLSGVPLGRRLAGVPLGRRLAGVPLGWRLAGVGGRWSSVTRLAGHWRVINRIVSILLHAGFDIQYTVTELVGFNYESCSSA